MTNNMKYLKLFTELDFKDVTNLIKESQNFSKTGYEFIEFAGRKSSSPTIYVDYLRNVDDSGKKFTCQVGEYVLSYDGTTKREQVSTCTLNIWEQKSASGKASSSLNSEQVMNPDGSGVKPEAVFELLPGRILTEQDKKRRKAEMEIAQSKAKMEIDAAGGYEGPGTKTAYAFYNPVGVKDNEYRWVEVVDDNLIDCDKRHNSISDLIYKIEQEIKRKTT